MVFSGKTAKNCKESWGMGLLLVFFPEENNHNNTNSPTSATAINVDKNSKNKFFAIRRSNSNRLLTKAQSTISICALLVFVTLLLFTLSTFEPNARTSPSNSGQIAVNSRRFLTEKRNRNPNFAVSSRWFSVVWKRRPNSSTRDGRNDSVSRPQKALQGLGILYRRGTKAMADLLVAHVAEDTSDDELRFFLRALHRSGLTARSDVVLVFASSSARLDSVVQTENESFLRLVEGYKKANKTTSLSGKRASSGFDVTQFKASKKDAGEPLWGKKGTTTRLLGNNSDESTQLSYGSVVGFEVSELDPENSLGGFFSDHVPMSLRRWACYPMLLGRVRRNFKHVALVDAKNAVVLGDQLGPVKNRSPESVNFYSGSVPGSGSRHVKRSPDKTQLHGGVNPAVIAGGARGVRRMAAAMLTEIVRAATAASAGQRKRKGGGPVTEVGILNRLAASEFLLKNVRVVKSGDSVPDAGELGRNSASFWKHHVVQRGNGNGHEVVKSLIMKQICSSEVDSSVYSDC